MKVASEIVTAAIGYLDDRIYKFAPEEESREAAEYANFRLRAAIEKNHDLLGMADHARPRCVWTGPRSSC